MIAAPCSKVAPIAQEKFTANGFTIMPESRCHFCYQLRAIRLKDSEGHTISNVRKAMHRYMSAGKEQDAAGAWYVHSGLMAGGELQFSDTKGSCEAQLLFHYSWYATEFLVFIPVDGDPATRPSNLMLEQAYLAAIAEKTQKQTAP